MLVHSEQAKKSKAMQHLTDKDRTFKCRVFCKLTQCLSATSMPFLAIKITAVILTVNVQLH
jgi:hypothetical protein